MKLCLAEMKKALEADMYHRADAVTDTYATHQHISFEIYHDQRRVYNIFQCLAGLHKERLGTKKPSDDYTECWSNLETHLNGLQFS
jgi:hypothetical protein